MDNQIRILFQLGPPTAVLESRAPAYAGAFQSLRGSARRAARSFQVHSIDAWLEPFYRAMLLSLDLLQRSLHGPERSVQVDADTLDHSDDRNRNAGCDEPIFNGRGSGFAFQERPHEATHKSAPTSLISNQPQNC